jgi:hypothetical protein
MKSILALCGAVLAAGCSSVPVQVQKVDSNLTCDTALMERVDRVWQPVMTQRYWVRCPLVRRDSNKPS